MHKKLPDTARDSQSWCWAANLSPELYTTYSNSSLLKPFSVNFLYCVWSLHDTKKEIISIMFLQPLCRYSFLRYTIHKL